MGMASTSRTGSRRRTSTATWSKQAGAPLYGHGIYFADRITKADEYSDMVEAGRRAALWAWHLLRGPDHEGGRVQRHGRSRQARRSMGMASTSRTGSRRRTSTATWS